MALVFLFFWCSRRFLENQKNFRENQKYQRTPKKTKKTFGKTKKQSFQRFQTHPWILVWLFFFVWFSLRFLQNQKILRENQKYQRKPKKTKKPSRKPKIPKKTKKIFGKTKKTKRKIISKGVSETFENFVFLVFPNVFLAFFGFLWYCWFSRWCFCFCSKNLREN